jgi:hypothetical protein
MGNMSANEELEEHVHEAKEPFDKRVAATMAIIAATLAVVSVSGHILTTDELLAQAKASDMWAQYQAKSIRRFSAEATRDELSSAKSDQALVAKYSQAMEHYKKDEEGIKEKAEEFEKESDTAGKKALRLHFGEVFLEIAIVFSSLAILTKRDLLYWVAVLSGASGVVLGCLAFFV